MTRHYRHFSVLLAAAILTACGIGTTHHPTDVEREAFEQAGPIEPQLDEARLLSGIPNPGPYRVVPGDLLEIRGPAAFFASATNGPAHGVHSSRVASDGTIQLPLGGTIEVAGDTVAEIEPKIVDYIHPRFLVNRPSIVVAIHDHHRVKVAILGAVEEPGVHELRSDQMSLFGALTEAGGILKASTLQGAGARIIRIQKPGESRTQAFALPVKGLNVPFADVALTGGETIAVERWHPQLFTVVGLVEKPGAYEYPPETSYNLMQALAIAGGTDRIAAPPYATILRRDASGRILGVTFEINGTDIVEASSVLIKPGDVVAVQHTIGSWSRSFLATVFRAQLNFFVDPLDTR